MKCVGNLSKMLVHDASPVEYQLPLGDSRIGINEWLGHSISITHSGLIHCIACARVTRKSFNQGHCYPCFQSLASCDRCIMSPELCHFHLGTCREPEFGQNHCMQPHIVYLANSSGPKVGITRATQLPTRWIDQGAIAALPLFKVTSRYDSGRIEAALRTNMSDRTNWQRMLKNQVETVDLAEFWREIANEHDWTPDILRTISGAMSLESIDDAEQLAFTYPVIEYPQKVKALNLDKTPSISGRLCGIKGQYLILDTGVINIRKFSGYEVEISAA